MCLHLLPTSASSQLCLTITTSGVGGGGNKKPQTTCLETQMDNILTAEILKCGVSIRIQVTISTAL